MRTALKLAALVLVGAAGYEAYSIWTDIRLGDEALALCGDGAPFRSRPECNRPDVRALIESRKELDKQWRALRDLAAPKR